jgi:hypothetical protein
VAEVQIMFCCSFSLFAALSQPRVYSTFMEYTLLLLGENNFCCSFSLFALSQTSSSLLHGDECQSHARINSCRASDNCVLTKNDLKSRSSAIRNKGLKSNACKTFWDYRQFFSD